MVHPVASAGLVAGATGTNPPQTTETLCRDTLPALQCPPFEAVGASCYRAGTANIRRNYNWFGRTRLSCGDRAAAATAKKAIGMLRPQPS